MSFRRRALRWLGLIVIGLLVGGGIAIYRMTRKEQSRIEEVRQRVTPRLSRDLAAKGLALGSPAFIRIVKEENELELWMKPARSSSFQLCSTWKVAARSGKLGPKLKEGDRQAPEGFYSVAKPQLNPNSDYHLAFNIGYPNELDRALNRTGSFIMVHGSNVSIGCFAMTDPVIEEIYLIVEAALKKGQEAVPVHVFPFRMTEGRMTEAQISNAEWLEFWTDLKQGHDAFEAKKIPPSVTVRNGRYLVSAGN